MNRQLFWRVFLLFCWRCGFRGLDKVFPSVVVLVPSDLATESLRLRLRSSLRQYGALAVASGLNAGLKPRSTSEAKATAEATAKATAEATAKATARARAKATARARAKATARARAKAKCRSFDFALRAARFAQDDTSLWDVLMAAKWGLKSGSSFPSQPASWLGPGTSLECPTLAASPPQRAKLAGDPGRSAEEGHPILGWVLGRGWRSADFSNSTSVRPVRQQQR